MVIEAGPKANAAPTGNDAAMKMPNACAANASQIMMETNVQKYSAPSRNPTTLYTNAQKNNLGNSFGSSAMYLEM